ncbi:hypothetical protein Bca4012_086897 [Brassica carinata]
MLYLIDSLEGAAFADPLFSRCCCFKLLSNLVAIGSNAKVSLTHVEPNIVGCNLTSNTSNYQSSNSVPFLKNTRCLTNSQNYIYGACAVYKEDVKECNGNGCCKVGLREHQQAIGIRIESNDSTTTREEKYRVAFLTVESYTFSNATNPQELFEKGYARLSLGWVIQTKNHSFVSSLSCDNRDIYENTTVAAGSQRKCICIKSTIAKISYAHCACRRGYTGNVYDPHGCQDVNECKTEHISCGGMNTCVNTEGSHHCAGDKKKAILIELNTSQGNVEKTKIFSSRELEKATENFSQSRVLGQGGQGTVYKGMLVDGRTVAVKKSKVMDEDQLQDFINEVVILSQINHRHIVKLLGCCLETEVPILVYEFIINGNLFQHIHEESDDYTMIWGIRLRIAVDVAGALSYLHSSANSPIYHRDIKSTNILLAEPSFGVVLAELITGDKPVIMVQNTREIISLAEHFRLAVKEKRFSDIRDARIKEDCKMEQVMAVANLAVKCMSSKGNKRSNMREICTELERISASPEDSHVQVMIDEAEEDEEEEVRNMVNRGDSLSVGLTAPACGIVASPSSSDAESLFPRPTW